MRASLLLGLGASALVACGGNVVVDGTSVGAGGEAGTGAAATTTTSSGAGAASCAELSAAFEAAHTAAIACHAGDPPSVCMGQAPDDCGCTQIANATGSLAEDDTAAYQALQAAGCAPECTLCSVPGFMFAQCIATPAGYQCGQGPG